MLRVFLIGAAMAAATFPQAVSAQETGASTSSKGCKLSAPKKRGSAMLGSMLGGFANRALGRVGGLSSYVPLSQFSSTLTEAIACRLDAKEQEKAAAATNEAVRGGVGTSSSWTSDTRKGVSGSSTVTAATQTADGSSCVSVNDVVIVDGEETKVSKRMCRTPGSSAYVLAA